MMRLSFPIQLRLPVPERLVLRRGRWKRVPLAVRYGLLERAGHRPVLIDAGWPARSASDSLALRIYHAIMPVESETDKAISMLEIGSVLLSHLHADHVGALCSLSSDIPIHVDAEAWQQARAGGSKMLRHAVFPELLPDRTVHDLGAGAVVSLPFGLGTGHDIFGDGSVLAVSLPGHAQGHHGFFFPDFAPPVLYAADAQWVIDGLTPGRDPSWPMTQVYSDRAAVLDTIARLRAFMAGGGIVVLNHDPAPIGPFVI